MISRIRNITLLTLLALLVCAPCLVVVAKTVCPQALPSFLADDEAQYLTGSRPNISVRDNLNLSGLVSGDLQLAIDSYVSSNVPLQAPAVMTLAQIQKTVIALSGLPFNWKVSPVRLGEATFKTDEDLLVTATWKGSDDVRQIFSNFTTGLAGVAQRHPNIRFCTYIVDDSETSYANPVGHLTTGTYYTLDAFSDLTDSAETIYTIIDPSDVDLSSNASFNDASSEAVSSGAITPPGFLNKNQQPGIEELIAINVRDLPNLAFCTDLYLDEATYAENFFSSDLHWNAYGAQRGYSTIMDALEREDISSELAVTKVDGPKFAGYYSRTGLDVHYDDPLVLENPLFEQVQVSTDPLDGYAPNAEASYSPYASHSSYWNAKEQEQRWNFYGLWYPNYTHIKGVGTGNLLIVGDSMSDSLKGPLALSFANITCIREMHAGNKGDTTLEDYLAAGNYDTVLFIGRTENFVDFSFRNPQFFKLK